MISVHDAVAELHRIVYEERKVQSPARLNLLAEYCSQELAVRGVVGATKGLKINGIGRAKQWDLAWKYDGKVRLAITTKSLLSNLAGTAPNRIDDLMGEVANVQLQSPEIVIGSIVVINKQLDADGGRWTNWLRSRLENLSGRDAPAWSPGTFEAHVVLEASFKPKPRVLSPIAEFEEFFDTLIERVTARNPGIRSGSEAAERALL